VIRDAIEVLAPGALDRAVDRLVGLVVGDPFRSVAIGTALLYVGARLLGWWLVALILGASAWELVRWPGRLPRRWP
jgi:hypothetical protein